MKKVISILIATVIAVSSIVTAFAVPLNNRQESNNINGFINGITELAREYDANKEFTVPENDEISQIQDPSAPNTDTEMDEVRANTFAASAYEETENSDTIKYTLQDFQTARLIVRADGKFNKFGALEDVSGFKDFHILQYESPEAAKKAYDNLKSEKNVINVAPDEVVAPLQGEKVKTLSTSEIEEKDYLCDWSVDRTQSKRLQEYLTAKNIPMKEVIVGVVDDGVHYDHEFLKGRIYPTEFNSSTSGKEGDEYGSPDGHGTAVCSVIVDNTPENVKIRCYKVINDDGSATITQMCAGYFKAIENGVDVISVSLGYYDGTQLTEQAVKTAYEKGIPFFSTTGNTGYYDYNFVPSNIPECISVYATDKNNTNTLWATKSDNADISAPGEDIAIATKQNEYGIWSGTSFSAPCAASLAAILKAKNPNITVNEVEACLKSTALDVKIYNEFDERALDGYYSLLDGVGMIQFCNAFGLPELTAPEFNLENALYVGEQICSIQCADKNAVILYTTDGTYPDSENATEYNQPFPVIERTRIRAVAYYADGGYYSREVEITPRIQYTDDDENFTVTDDGVITSYSGTVADLFIPDTINGITVTGIEAGAFNVSTLVGLTLPKGVTEIPQSAFYQNQSLEFIRGEGILNIETYAFYASALKYAEFPNAKVIGDVSFKLTKNFCYGDFSNVEKIEVRAFQYSQIVSFRGNEVASVERGAFEYCYRLESVSIPKCTEYIYKVGSNGEFYTDGCLQIVDMPLVRNLLRGVLEDTRIKEADFAFLKKMDKKALYNCTNLRYINMPVLETIPDLAFNGKYMDTANSKPRVYYFDNVKQIGADAFGIYPTARIEFSHIETAQSLPNSNDEEAFPCRCIISMPSTFKKCTEDTKGRNYKVYGTQGTYSEQWANENGHEFIEISQDTAVLTQLPMQYTDTDETLTADVIGFNRTYQWHGSFTADNTAGTPIDGATDKNFNPTDYPAYPYYYCVVTSTDVGYDPIEIRTGVTANKVASADYSAYDAVVLKANALEREYYKDLTALDAALAVDVSGLTIAEQAIVDAQTKAIEDALIALELKDADYSAYNAAVEKANALDNNLYADITELDKLLADDISGLTIINQDTVDNQTRAIEDALKNLVLKPADYTEYYKAVEQANALDRSLYADLSALDEALAVDVSGKNITEQTEVDAQTQAILNAISALVYKSADYSEVEKAIASIPEDLSVYTDESASALQEILNTVDYSLNIMEQETVDGYAKAITDAVNSLELKPVTPPATNPTEPSEPTRPTQPAISNDTPNPDIPNTGTEHVIVFSFAFLCLCGAIVFTATRRKEKIKK